MLICLLVRTSRLIQGKHLLFTIFTFHSLTLNQPSRSTKWLTVYNLKSFVLDDLTNSRRLYQLAKSSAQFEIHLMTNHRQNFTIDLIFKLPPVSVWCIALLI
ncbi:hypothetical protein T07_13853 [Trichinella nelsoni]|uniref:Uncharacterized protein n=1 Tax=Trichinella nelsoni TaxID=6336 RepID=A0A0V0RY09_9BILA|nr:hypothetical protein T07_13853 [Trichinella nelsoni]